MLALNNEQRLLVTTVHDLAETEFSSQAGTWNGDWPGENLRLLTEHGFLGINMPEEYGGGGMSEYEAMLIAETVGRVCPDTAYAVNGQQMVALRAIVMFGTDAARETYLPPVIAGESRVSIAISEPQAGSDVQAMSTTVTEENGDLVVNGEKMWVSGFHDATAALVWVKFLDGMGLVIVDLDDPGVEVAQHYTNMAGHDQTHFYMHDITVPRENVVTRGKKAFKRQLTALNWEPIGSAATCNVIALCAFDAPLESAGDREQFGQPIADFQSMEWKLTDMAAEIEASRSLAYRAAAEAERRDRAPDRLKSSVANLYSARMVEEVVSEAVHVHGANGYQLGHLLEYPYRFARSRRIAAGTDEI